MIKIIIAMLMIMMKTQGTHALFIIIIITVAIVTDHPDDNDEKSSWRESRLAALGPGWTALESR